MPAMIGILKVDDYKARGTTLATILVATLIASIFYSRKNYLNWQIIIPLVIGGLVGGYIGAQLTNKIPKNILNIIFNLFLIFISIKIILNK